MRYSWILALLGAGLVTSGTLSAGMVTIDFEGVPDLTSAGSTYAAQGVTFGSGLIVVSGAFGGSLNEIDFPPLPPGQAVFLNELDTTSLAFSQPIFSFSGYFTYGGPITLNFYAAGNVLLTTLTSAFQTNIATGGDAGSSPNELISAPALADAIRVDILAPATDFTLDNLSFNTSSPGGTGVPEPGTGMLISVAGAVVFLARRYVPR